MLPTLPDPTSATYEDWAAELHEALGFKGAAPTVETDWKNFAYSALGDVAFSAQPDPAYFSDWRAWALTLR